jgi:cytochrome b
MRGEATGAGAPTILGPAAAGRVWDLPTRLFHWSLAALVVFSFTTAKLGGNWIDWHMRSGYAVLALLLFRLLWGFAGARYALFANFVRGPLAVFAHLRGRYGPYAGHNPLGALSVLALLAALLLQAATGLFANDDIASEGPLAKLVSNATSNRLSGIHRTNEWVLVALVALHLAAIAFYALVRRDNLVRPMIVGDRPGLALPPAADDAAIRLRAALLAALAAALVAYVVTL